MVTPLAYPPSSPYHTQQARGDDAAPANEEGAIVEERLVQDPQYEMRAKDVAMQAAEAGAGRGELRPGLHRDCGTP